MIKLDRPPPPKEFEKKALRAIEDAREFFNLPEEKRRQRRYHFKPNVIQSVRGELRNIFHSKCAYCETLLSPASFGSIDQHRPKGSVAESPEHSGYWWLFAAWDNLHYSCQRCNVGKRNRFPLAPRGKRAFTPEDDLSAELPLLIDPCIDNPKEHLVFERDGSVSGKTERGNASIAVYGLNSSDLVEDRHIKAEEFKLKLATFINVFAKGEKIDLKDQIEKLLGDDQEYAGMKRQLISEMRKEVMEKLGLKGLPFGEELVSQIIDKKATKVSSEELLAARKQYKVFKQEQESYSLEEKDGRKTFRDQQRQIESIRIENVKAIESLSVDLSEPRGSGAPWLMLLGENATGKSTVLQCIALTLIGAKYFAQLVKDGVIQPGKYVRNGCDHGSVEIKLKGFSHHHKLTFLKSHVEFTNPQGEVTRVSQKKTKMVVDGEGWKPQVQLLGYGATRLLPRRKTEQSNRVTRVDNLFDPFVPLSDASLWLTKLDQTEFDRAAIVIKDLLPIDGRSELTRSAKKIKFEDGISENVLEDLSDGYQSTIAMTVDILEALSHVWPRWDKAEAIVLLDEVGANLHPRWQMQIVGDLRKALPGVQFIATTHNPLCLRGLEEGEVAVMVRNESGRIISNIDLPSVSSLRTDQILASQHFGLSSTYDPRYERLFRRYYELLRKKNKSKNDKKLIERCKEVLDGLQLLGANRRERLMLEAIDRYLAPNPDALNEEERKEKRRKLSLELDKILEEVGA